MAPASPLALLLVAFVSGFGSTVGEVFHNHFAVHVVGGSKEPTRVDQLARRHGLINRGQVGSLQDHFVLENPRLAKRSTNAASPEHHVALREDSDVNWVEQLVELRRLKRDLGEEEGNDLEVQDVMTSFSMPDPLFHRQWYLDHGAVDGSDMNVQPAWRMGYTGKGVVVTILDDGIQYNHPDLKQNYDPEASYDINNDDPDPTPRDNGDNRHGTRCAGEVAAEAFNKVCGVGVAFNASIGGVRMLDGMVNDAVEANALSLKPSHIDVYSASWGPEDDGKTVDGPGPLAKKAFIQGVNQGRQGKGSIFVWASGNGGRKTDNCNCDGYTNSIFTLSISSATQAGRKPWYLEECSSTLATTYSSGSPSQDASITTVDQDARLRKDKLCTSSHTGTSASAPIAAGMCALALEANPELTWRDMQHLVILSSTPDPLLHETGWLMNGVGRKYSHKFGYGLMDAAAMVVAAKDWPGVGEQLICETDTQSPDIEIPARSDEVARVSMSTTACADSDSHVRYLEHVQCKISLHYNPRGALHILLTSPAGTKSSLLLPRPKDKTNAGFDEWPFLSVHFWGENPTGTWTLEVNRTPGISVAKPTGMLKKWKLLFYGTSKRSPQGKEVEEENVNSIHEGAMTFSLEREEEEIESHETDFGEVQHHNLAANMSIIEHNSLLGPDGCNVECVGGCEGPGPQQCTSCVNLRYRSICVSKCPKKTFPTVEKTCESCHSRCNLCFGSRQNQCLSCPPGLSLMVDSSECVQRCPPGYRLRKATKECLACPENCQDCNSLLQAVEDEAVCTKCLKDLFLHVSTGACLSNCPRGFYADKKTKECRKCHSRCSTCVGPLATQCAQCKDGTFYYQRKCVDECPDGFRPEPWTSECVPCPQVCARCDADGRCFRCIEKWTPSIKDGKNSGLCVADNGCPEGTYANAQLACRKCHESCSTCTDSTTDGCLSCAAGHFLHISTCVDQCPQSTFQSGAECRHCPHACLECQDLRSCLTCHAGYFISADNRTCVANCESGERMVGGRCQKCPPSCSSCDQAGKCLSCQENNVLLDGECSHECPQGHFFSEHKCVPCHPTCKNCSDRGPHHCVTCPLGMKLSADGQCLSCRPGYFFDNPKVTCAACHGTCAECLGPLATDCAACKAPLRLDPWNASCVPCCDEDGRGGDRTDCCQCDRRRSRCVQASRSRRRSSFRPDLSGVSMTFPTSQSTLFLLALASSTVAFVTFQLLKKRWRRHLRRHIRVGAGILGSVSEGTKYDQVPLMRIDASDDNDGEDLTMLQNEDSA